MDDTPKPTPPLTDEHRVILADALAGASDPTGIGRYTADALRVLLDAYDERGGALRDARSFIGARFKVRKILVRIDAALRAPATTTKKGA